MAEVGASATRLAAALRGSLANGGGERGGHSRADGIRRRSGRGRVHFRGHHRQGRQRRKKKTGRGPWQDSSRRRGRPSPPAIGPDSVGGRDSTANRRRGVWNNGGASKAVVDMALLGVARAADAHVQRSGSSIWCVWVPLKPSAAR